MGRLVYRLFTVMVGVYLLMGRPMDVKAGDYAGDFTRIGVGARALAMGGAYIAVANDVSAGYWNPAGLTDNGPFSMQLEHVPMFDGLAQYNTASAVLCVNDQTAIGLNWIRLGIDEIPRYSALQGSKLDRLGLGLNRSTGEAEGYFSDQENAFMLSFSRSVFIDLLLGSELSRIVLPTQISFGITGKYIHHKLDKYAGSGQGIDAGVLVRFMPQISEDSVPITWISLAATVRDLARTSITWNTQSEQQDKMDRMIVAGTAVSHSLTRFRTRLTLAFDQELSAAKDYYAGGEMSFYNTIHLRGGYYRQHLTAGAGLDIYGMTVDYAFIASDLGNTHRVSAAYTF